MRRLSLIALVGEHAYGSPGERRISDSVSVGGLVLPAEDQHLLKQLDFLHREQVRSQWATCAACSEGRRFDSTK